MFVLVYGQLMLSRTVTVGPPICVKFALIFCIFRVLYFCVLIFVFLCTHVAAYFLVRFCVMAHCVYVRVKPVCCMVRSAVTNSH